MNILITGGAGFIGTHLVELFLNRNDNVIVVDNLLTGSEDNVNIFCENKNYSFINLDVQNYIHIEQDIDYILHLASAASPKAYTQYPINTLKAGSFGTINSLGLAKAKGAKYLKYLHNLKHTGEELIPMELGACMMRLKDFLKHLLQVTTEFTILTLE